MYQRIFLNPKAPLWNNFCYKAKEMTSYVSVWDIPNTYVVREWIARNTIWKTRRSKIILRLLFRIKFDAVFGPWMFWRLSKFASDAAFRVSQVIHIRSGNRLSRARHDDCVELGHWAVSRLLRLSTMNRGVLHSSSAARRVQNCVFF